MTHSSSKGGGKTCWMWYEVLHHSLTSRICFQLFVRHDLWFNSLCSGGDVRSANSDPPQRERAEVSGVESNGPEGPGSGGSFRSREPQRGAGGSQDRTTGMKHSFSGNRDIFFSSNFQIIQSQGEMSKREQDVGLLWQTRFKSGCPTWEITHLPKQNPSRPRRIFWFYKVFCWAVLSPQHRFIRHRTPLSLSNEKELNSYFSLTCQLLV